MQTFLQIAQTISYMPNSELSTINGITDITNEERNAINEALKTVWNESSTFDFRYKKITFPTVVGQADYDMPIGYIKDKGLQKVIIAGHSMGGGGVYKYSSLFP